MEESGQQGCYVLLSVSGNFAVEKENMKTVKIFMAAALAAFLFVSCSEKKPSTDIITHKEKSKVPTEPVKMQDYDHAETVEWLGKEYKISISRRAENDSSIVEDDSGSKYHNNRITVRITRPDGTDFFDKTFTKNDFASVVNADYRRKSTLLGIVVDHVEGGNLYLAASVGSPDALSDEYVPLIITVSRTGGVSMAKDNRPDSGGERAEEDV